jgi:hypothetical protein
VLTIEQGMVYIALSSQPWTTWCFETPAGVIPGPADIRACRRQGSLKAYLDVKPAHTEIGVLEGGAHGGLDPEGDRKIEPGRQITLAQALIFDDEDQGAKARLNKAGPEESPSHRKKPTDAEETGRPNLTMTPASPGTWAADWPPSPLLVVRWRSAAAGAGAAAVAVAAVAAVPSARWTDPSRP